MPPPPPPPLLCVHGIWDTGAVFDRMAELLRGQGWPEIQALDLSPNDGSADIPALAAQVDQAAAGLLARTGQARLDVIGFSMGALVCRYFLQRLGGREK